MKKVTLKERLIVDSKIIYREIVGDKECPRHATCYSGSLLDAEVTHWMPLACALSAQARAAIEAAEGDEELGRGWSVEKKWTTKAGYEARIHKYTPATPYDMQFYCGYVKASKGMALYESKEMYPNFEVNGGVTFFGNLFKHDAEAGVKWIGFDCNHIWDHECPKDIGFMEMECESLARQIKKRESSAEGRE